MDLYPRSLVFPPCPIRDQMTSHLMQKRSFAYIRVPLKSQN